jgi:hypothetical protein
MGHSLEQDHSPARRIAFCPATTASCGSDPRPKPAGPGESTGCFGETTPQLWGFGATVGRLPLIRAAAEYGLLRAGPAR